MKWQDRKIIFDYSLTVGPQSTYSYMESWHKGEFISSSYAKYQFSPEHMSSPQPMPVPEPMRDFQEDDAMFYVLVNEYLFKSLMAALHENTPVLHVLGDAEELSETYRNLLISVIKHYVTEDALARTNILVEVVADITPNVELTSAGINVTLSGVWKLTFGDMHLNRYFAKGDRMVDL
ncbi:uncharacterized protein LOC131935425 [Physella acuta]|uniref:uncharacterized protein LOC131935425 n=1 Tax=Physella acuta TaxID=109671 RepID=UPI0027DDC430|nr:uncharacterized protein LOC131935425 [Physella acuta]